VGYEGERCGEPQTNLAWRRTPGALVVRERQKASLIRTVVLMLC